MEQGEVMNLTYSSNCWNTREMEGSGDGGWNPPKKEKERMDESVNSSVRQIFY